MTSSMTMIRMPHMATPWKTKTLGMAPTRSSLRGWSLWWLDFSINSPRFWSMAMVPPVVSAPAILELREMPLMMMMWLTWNLPLKGGGGEGDEVHYLKEFNWLQSPKFNGSSYPGLKSPKVRFTISTPNSGFSMLPSICGLGLHLRNSREERCVGGGPLANLMQLLGRTSSIELFATNVYRRARRDELYSLE